MLLLFFRRTAFVISVYWSGGESGEAAEEEAEEMAKPGIAAFCAAAVINSVAEEKIDDASIGEKAEAEETCHFAFGGSLLAIVVVAVGKKSICWLAARFRAACCCWLPNISPPPPLPPPPLIEEGGPCLPPRKAAVEFR